MAAECGDSNNDGDNESLRAGWIRGNAVPPFARIHRVSFCMRRHLQPERVPHRVEADSAHRAQYDRPQHLLRALRLLGRRARLRRVECQPKEPRLLPARVVRSQPGREVRIGQATRRAPGTDAAAAHAALARAAAPRADPTRSVTCFLLPPPVHTSVEESARGESEKQGSGGGCRGGGGGGRRSWSLCTFRRATCRDT